ncbi:MAG: hypothetical protein EOO90_21120 [Pedobacter sp.]|nr:MAG: hypothetical protein EOO90_21120 [Pedobacter sp.]
MRFLFVLFVFLLIFVNVNAQRRDKDSDKLVDSNRVDTLADNKNYINKGKLAGKTAIRRSLILPGLGQAYNYGLIVNDIKSGRIQGKAFGRKLAVIGKIGGIYVAGTMLTMSYFENNSNYKLFLKELQYRLVNNDQPDPNGPLTAYKNTSDLYAGKAIYKNNREVVLIFLGVTYGLNVLDAYVTSRLHYLSVDEKLSFKVSPTVINSGPMYGFNSFTPALKLTLNL